MTAARLVVCPLTRVHETLAATGAASLVTLLSPGGVTLDRPAAIAPGRHLVIGVSDITAAREGHTHPAQDHVDRLLTFVREWDQRAPLLIHCYAGVSRSTAAAYMALCLLSPGRSEEEHASALRAASPTATPNPLMVALADAALERSGRMIAAVARIGRGAECFEGAPFELSLGARGAA